MDLLGGEQASLNLVRRLFKSQEVRYKWKFRHDSAPGKHNIEVNMDSTALSFPCELHELVYVMPNVSFKGPGSTFEGRAFVPTLEGGRLDVVTGVTVRPVPTGGDDGSSSSEERFLTLPRHRFTLDLTGTFELSCTSSFEDDAEEHLLDSEAETLFASGVAYAFANETLRRLAWMQTERSGIRRPLKMEVEGLKRNTLETQSRTVLGASGTVPNNVLLRRLSFSAARDRIRAAYMSLGADERNIYLIPPGEESLLAPSFDNSDWTTPGVRTIVEERLKQWESVALDHTEAPRLRHERIVKSRTIALPQAVVDAELFEAKDTEKARSVLKKHRDDKTKPLSTRPLQSDELRRYANMTTHVFFHTVKEWEDLAMNKRMLLKTIINYAVQKKEPSDEEFEEAKRVISGHLRHNGAKGVSRALTRLHTLLATIPVYDADAGPVLFGGEAFRRLVYLLSLKTVRSAVEDAYWIAVLFSKQQGRELRPRTDTRYNDALELLQNLHTFHKNLPTAQRVAPSITEITNALKDKLETMKELLLKKAIIQPSQTKHMIDRDGYVEVTVFQSSFGNEPASMGAAAAPNRRFIMQAIDRALLRLFLNPNVVGMNAYFPELQ